MWKPAFGLGLVGFEIGDDFADGAEFDDRVFVYHSGQKGEMTDKINLAGNALGKTKNMVLGIIRENVGAFVPGDRELVLDVGQGCLQIEWAQMVAGGNALGKRLVNGKAQGVTQFRVANQQQRSQGLAVHLSREQQAELLKSLGGQMMSLVNNDHRTAMFVLQQILEGGADARHHFGTAE